MLPGDNDAYGASLVGFGVMGMGESVIPYLGILFSLVARATRARPLATANPVISGLAVTGGPLLRQRLRMVTVSVPMQQ